MVATISIKADVIENSIRTQNFMCPAKMLDKYNFTLLEFFYLLSSPLLQGKAMSLCGPVRCLKLTIKATYKKKMLPKRNIKGFT